jgi:MFS superfamily sulfate permease-like transporter
MPMPSLPQLKLLPELFPSALGIAAVVVAVHISLAKVFAKRFSYRIDAGQV